MLYRADDTSKPISQRRISVTIALIVVKFSENVDFDMEFYCTKTRNHDLKSDGTR